MEIEEKQAIGDAMVRPGDNKDCAQGSGKGVGESQQMQLKAEVVKEEAMAEVETEFGATKEEPSKKKDLAPSSMTIWLQFRDICSEGER